MANTGLVSAHQLSSYANPQAGQAGTASVVLGNDNTTVSGYNTHDSDPTIHLQNSTFATKPAAAASTGSWLTYDNTTAPAQVRMFWSNGSSWYEQNYFGTSVTVASINAKAAQPSFWHLTVADLTTMAANVGGGLLFQGYKTGVSNLGAFGAIAGYKTNATPGDENGGVRIYYSIAGTLTQGVQIDNAGLATFAAGIAAVGAVSSIDSLGYRATAGGIVTQSGAVKTDAVTLNKPCGQIITSTASMLPAAEVVFTVSNSTVVATDTIILNRQSGGTAASYHLGVDAVVSGSFNVALSNLNAATLGEAVTINFAVLKSVNA